MSIKVISVNIFLYENSHGLVFVIVICSYSISYSQVGIGITAPDSSSILDIQSSVSGVLLPRLTDGERDAIVNPATGLLIFDTTSNTFQYNFGTPASSQRYSIKPEPTPTPVQINGYVQSNGVFTGTSGYNVVREAAGTYRIDMNSSASDTQYTVIATTDRTSGTDDRFIGVSNRTTNSFRIFISDKDDGDSTNNYVDNAFSFVVYFN